MNVFTYGSLMFPEVWTRVVRGLYRQAPGTLEGYRRLAVKDETYPAMAPADGCRVEGIVYFGVDALDVEALDAFEGADYRRIDAVVAIPDGSRVEAQTYLFLPAERLADFLWLPEHFALEVFLATYCNLRPPAEDTTSTADESFQIRA